MANGDAAEQSPIVVPISIAYGAGGYCAKLAVGSGDGQEAVVVLDTGSSSMAIDSDAYDPDLDDDRLSTLYGQSEEYGSKSSDWTGAVIQTTATFSGTKIGTSTSTSVALDDTNIAIWCPDGTPTDFGDADGILGLAYASLDDAIEYDKKTYTGDQDSPCGFGTVVDGDATIRPYFTKLETAGIEANRFSLGTKRSMTSHSTPDPMTDPVNSGILVLGGGEELNPAGPYLDVALVHEEYYGVKLTAFTVAGVAYSVLANATTIVDSGTQAITTPLSNEQIINSWYYNTAHMGIVSAALDGPVDNPDLTGWKDFVAVLEGSDGESVTLHVPAENYWQLDAPEKGKASFMISSQLTKPGDHDEFVLGLPLMNSYFCIFDRANDRIRFGPATWPS